MKTRRQRIQLFSALSVIVSIGCLATTVVVAQTRQSNNSRPPAPQPQPQPRNQAEMDAEKAAIWNSPQMLRARAWLHDYTSKSAKITPEEGRKYMQELENLTPTQMKLWLMKFEHEEQIKQQQYNMWQQSQQALAAQAQAAHRATQQSLANFDSEQSQAAQQEQGQLNEEAEERQQRSEENQFAPVGPYGPYNWGFNPGYGGVHFHYHLYPYAN